MAMTLGNTPEQTLQNALLLGMMLFYFPEQRSLFVFIRAIKCDNILLPACFEQILWPNSAYFVRSDEDAKPEQVVVRLVKAQN